MDNKQTAPAHTPVPWTVERDDAAWGRYIVVEAQRQLFDMEDHYDNWGPLLEIDRANGRFIERACNAHDGLRSASQRLYDALQRYLIDIPDRDLPEDLVEGMDALEAAWHQADGTQPGHEQAS